MPQPITHFEINARDSVKISNFYSGLFGWNIDANNPMNYGLVSTKDGDLGIDGGIYQQDDAGDALGVRIYAQVDDAQDYLNKAEELGGEIVGQAMEVPGAGIIVGMFTDLEGNLFGVVQHVGQN
jgi:predicted enzyme related to lactoylglutathione lyase